MFLLKSWVGILLLLLESLVVRAQAGIVDHSCRDLIDRSGSRIVWYGDVSGYLETALEQAAEIAAAGRSSLLDYADVKGNWFQLTRTYLTLVALQGNSPDRWAIARGMSMSTPF